MFDIFQACISPNRFIIHENIFDEFVETLKNRIVSEIVVGNGTDPKSTIGPLINKAQVEKVSYNIFDIIVTRNLNY